jgi:hypothetical protein
MTEPVGSSPLPAPLLPGASVVTCLSAVPVTPLRFSKAVVSSCRKRGAPWWLLLTRFGLYCTTVEPLGKYLAGRNF